VDHRLNKEIKNFITTNKVLTSLNNRTRAIGFSSDAFTVIAMDTVENYNT